MYLFLNVCDSETATYNTIMRFTSIWYDFDEGTIVIDTEDGNSYCSLAPKDEYDHFLDMVYSDMAAGKTCSAMSEYGKFVVYPDDENDTEEMQAYRRLLAATK